MTPTELIAEGLGFIAIGIGFLIFQQRKRANILVFKIISDVLWIIHFLLLSATSGMVLTIVGVIRNTTFLAFALKDKDIKPAWLLLFSAAGIGAIILTWTDIYSICSIISCVLATLRFWQKKPTNIKISTIFVCISQITYACFVGSLSVVINELITLSSIAIFFTRIYVEKKRSSEELRFWFAT